MILLTVDARRLLGPVLSRHFLTCWSCLFHKTNGLGFLLFNRGWLLHQFFRLLYRFRQAVDVLRTVVLWLLTVELFILDLLEILEFVIWLAFIRVSMCEINRDWRMFSNCHIVAFRRWVIWSTLNWVILRNILMCL